VQTPILFTLFTTSRRAPPDRVLRGRVLRGDRAQLLHRQAFAPTSIHMQESQTMHIVEAEVRALPSAAVCGGVCTVRDASQLRLDNDVLNLLQPARVLLT
jgi:hypothetical protein